MCEDTVLHGMSHSYIILHRIQSIRLCNHVLGICVDIGNTTTTEDRNLQFNVFVPSAELSTNPVLPQISFCMKDNTNISEDTQETPQLRSTPL